MQAIIVANGTAEEIAALALAVQERPTGESTSSMDVLQAEESVGFNLG